MTRDEPDLTMSLAILRGQGWSVAVHNDYRQAGERYTFWLFTRDGMAVKGEGRTDIDALDQVREQVAALRAAGQVVVPVEDYAVLRMRCDMLSKLLRHELTVAEISEAVLEIRDAKEGEPT